MLKEETVFILGAGASAHYKFPLGDKLTNQIISFQTPQNFNDNEKRQITDIINILLANKNASPDLFNEYTNNHRNVLTYLINEVLEKYQKNINPDVGEVYQCEPEEDWYEYLFNNVSETIIPSDNVIETKMKFITFNYDNSFEEWFKQRFIASYKDINTKQDADSCFRNAMPLIHLHGVLGKRGKNIKLMNDDRPELFIQEKSRAQKWIQEATNICFLGFSFNKYNLEEIIPNIDALKNTNIFGTTYGFSTSEILRIQVKFKSGNIQLDFDGKYKILDYLKNISYKLFA